MPPFLGFSTPWQTSGDGRVLALDESDIKGAWPAVRVKPFHIRETGALLQGVEGHATEGLCVKKITSVHRRCGVG